MRLSWATFTLLLFLPAIDAAFWNWNWKSRSENQWEVWFYSSPVPGQDKPKKIKGKGSVGCKKITSLDALFHSAGMPKLGGCTVHLWENVQQCKTKAFYGELGYIHKNKQEYSWPNLKQGALKRDGGVNAYAVNCELPKELDKKLNANEGSGGTSNGHAGNTNPENGNTRNDNTGRVNTGSDNTGRVNTGNGNMEGNGNAQGNGKTGDGNSGPKEYVREHSFGSGRFREDF